jgi:hypothetical protein
MLLLFAPWDKHKSYNQDWDDTSWHYTKLTKVKADNETDSQKSDSDFKISSNNYPYISFSLPGFLYTFHLTPNLFPCFLHNKSLFTFYNFTNCHRWNWDVVNTAITASVIPVDMEVSYLKCCCLLTVFLNHAILHSFKGHEIKPWYYTTFL